ncbi:hypothetical protein CASFOL_035429 [Castilleja foliolosa]|uniref:F-box domain-containing protein n=1 Tax=Castilleja foliolosa TaxID=1961234 RepID=A0ABD3BTA4_9LAMI
MTSPNKRVKETPIDRLSALPDCLIIHILSLLEVKQSAITALLSKRWQFLWTQSPRLIFSEKRIWIQPPEVQDFVTRMNRTLVICGPNDLDTFELECPYSEIYNPDVNGWVGFAVKSKAKQLSLLLNRFSCDHCTLPRTMFQSAYLKRLKLRGCVVEPWGTIEWPSLTELSIEDSELQQPAMEKMLSGCPALHCLVLEDCRGFNRLEVSSKSLYELRVSDPKEYEDDNEPLLQISAPYLHTLSVTLYPKGRKLCLENTPSLVKATIEFVACGWDTGIEEVMDHVEELLEKICHVKVVDLRCNFIEVLSWVATNDYRFPQSARTSLSVEAPTVKCSIHVLVGLLESSPNLEALVIEGCHTDWEPCTYLDSKLDLECDLLHLKSIVIKDFTGPNLVGEPMLTLARILLNKLPELDKMVIHNKIFTSSSQPDVDESSNIAQKLLSYPKSSKAVILLK